MIGTRRLAAALISLCACTAPLATGTASDRGPIAPGPVLTYGPHGGVTGLAPGTLACIAYDDATNQCLVRAIREEEIVAAIDGESPDQTPVWMRSAYDAGSDVPAPHAVGTYGLPGLLEMHLDPVQAVLVRCLAGTPLGLPLDEWQDPFVYERGLVEECEAEARRASRGSDLPLTPAVLQEAAAIQNGAQRLVDSNAIYAAYAGRPAASITELLSGPALRAPPPRTPSMLPRGYSIARFARVTVDLAPGAADVCRAINLLLGRDWHALQDALPDGSRSGCYATPQGFRFETGG